MDRDKALSFFWVVEGEERCEMSKKLFLYIKLRIISRIIMDLKKIFVINGGQIFGHSGGRFNKTILEATRQFFSSLPGFKKSG